MSYLVFQASMVVAAACAKLAVLSMHASCGKGKMAPAMFFLAVEV